MVFIALLLFLNSGFFLLLIGYVAGAKAAYNRVERELDKVVTKKIQELELDDSLGTTSVGDPKQKSPRRS
jgi:hypothetical protein